MIACGGRAWDNLKDICRLQGFPASLWSGRVICYNIRVRRSDLSIYFGSLTTRDRIYLTLKKLIKKGRKENLRR
jgi:hypothetical protein